MQWIMTGYCLLEYLEGRSLLDEEHSTEMTAYPDNCYTHRLSECKVNARYALYT